MIRSSTPGRVCLFGEHQDYLQLPVIACAISLRLSIEVTPRRDRLISLDLPDIQETETIDLDAPIVYQSHRDYFRSAITVLQRQGYTFSHGCDGVVRSRIPINAGTSSSSALVVSWIGALLALCDQRPTLAPLDHARLAHEAEVLEFKEPGGMMDHITTALGGVVSIDFFPDARPKKLNPDLRSFVLGDSGEPKDTKGVLKRIHNGVSEIVEVISSSHPLFSLQSVAISDLGRFKKLIDSDQMDLLQATIANRDITVKARETFQNPVANHKGIGELLNTHHVNLRDTLKISTPKIDKMLDAALAAGALGGKINGSGGGGCMFAYAPVNPEAVAEAVEAAGGTAYVIHPEAGSTVEIEEDHRKEK